jgi:membrane protein DedA with SNARE-associated domain
VTAWATDLVGSAGAWGVFALMVLEVVFPPVPSEIILPLAGFTVAQDKMSFVAALVAATAGSMVGALIFYGLGAWLGEERLRRLIVRYGKYVLLTERDFDRADGWFHRHGLATVFVCRFVPGIRSLISLPAGIARLPFLPFLGLTLVGTTIWNAALIGAGWGLGASYEKVAGPIDVLAYVIAAALVVAIAWFVVTRLRARRATGGA